ncbi:Fatty-acid and retinol-binding protein 5 [Aphelenchoides besseyi]|nr:Fatty-acid and retinol-binding protein 5 [Aphelenchoides besseyi]KAI6216450.1 Fatty-acid and retinol-binding protein 5 [Aphelenchoides besseyi]
MSSTVWFNVFVCATLIAAVHGSVIGTLLELPKEYKDIPGKETMDAIKALSADELKLLKEAIEKCGGQYKSDDIAILEYLKPKSKALHDKVDGMAQKVNEQIKKISDAEAYLFIGELRTQFGQVNVKDYKAVVGQLTAWILRFHGLKKEGQDQIAQYFPGLASTLQQSPPIRV